MGDSAYSSLMMGVYVFVFIIATSLTVYLFTSTVTFADQAYEYGKVTTGDSVIETSSAPKYDTISGAELLTYYYNYKSQDKYGTTMTPNYDFRDIDDIDISKTYTLTYESANTGGKPVIRVSDVTSEVAPPVGGGPVVVDKRPTEPTIVTYPGVDTNVTPGTSVEFEAYSSVTTSFLTNYMSKYYWRIDYSPEDGRPDYVRTSYGTMGTLSILDDGDAIKFRDGVNMVYVTSEDALGNKSNTMSKRIEVGYLMPIINSISEVDGKVYDYGSINIESASGTSIRLTANAESRNQGGYIQKYDWYINDTLAQSGASDRFYRTYLPGEYRIKLVVHDSIQGTAEKTFTFSVKNIPAPTITCSNTNITNGSTLAIQDTTANLTFTASLDSKYAISKYIWNIDGTTYETTPTNGVNLNYGWSTHSINVYGVNAEGIVTDTATFAFTLKEDFVPFEQEYTSDGTYHQVTLPVGKYVIEAWGAQGGNGQGGLGGYTVGQLNLTSSRTLNIYAGDGAGYNGGGRSMLSYSIGGGASDVRMSDTTSTYKTFYDIAPGNGLSDDTNATHFHGPYAKLKKGTYQIDIYGNNLNYIEEVWACTDIGATRYTMVNLVRSNTHITYYVLVPNDKDLMELNVLEYNPATKSQITVSRVVASRLEDRIMVAGGGGGNGGGSVSCLGGSSGGLTGNTGGDLYGNPGTGATQTSGGAAGRPNGYGSSIGLFGIGGNGDVASNTSAGGGGGGYYGGGGASSDYTAYNDLDDSGGGGGSSFISGYTGCNAVDINGAHTGQVNHYSGLSFINTSMVAGTNAGNGKVKITRVR